MWQAAGLWSRVTGFHCRWPRSNGCSSIPAHAACFISSRFKHYPTPCTPHVSNRIQFTTFRISYRRYKQACHTQLDITLFCFRLPLPLLLLVLKDYKTLRRQRLQNHLCTSSIHVSFSALKVHNRTT